MSSNASASHTIHIWCGRFKMPSISTSLSSGFLLLLISYIISLPLYKWNTDVMIWNNKKQTTTLSCDLMGMQKAKVDKLNHYWIASYNHDTCVNNRSGTLLKSKLNNRCLTDRWRNYVRDEWMVAHLQAKSITSDEWSSINKVLVYTSLQPLCDHIATTLAQRQDLLCDLATKTIVADLWVIIFVARSFLVQ